MIGLQFVVILDGCSGNPSSRVRMIASSHGAVESSEQSRSTTNPREMLRTITLSKLVAASERDPRVVWIFRRDLTDRRSEASILGNTLLCSLQLEKSQFPLVVLFLHHTRYARLCSRRGVAPSRTVGSRHRGDLRLVPRYQFPDDSLARRADDWGSRRSRLHWLSFLLEVGHEPKTLPRTVRDHSRMRQDQLRRRRQFLL